MIVSRRRNVNINKCSPFKHTCKGCKVMKYCSRLCQKRDWKKRHRTQCIGVALKDLSVEEKKTIMAMKFVLLELEMSMSAKLL